MKEFSFTVRDPEGLHARPAGIIAKMCAKYKSAVKLTHGEKTVDAKRLFSIMGLAVKTGATINIAVEGEDEETAYTELLDFCNENL